MDLTSPETGNKSLISKPPSLFQRKPIHYLFRSISFLSVLVLCSIAINAVQAWGFLFLFALSRPFYRLFMRFTQRLFGILILFCTFIYSPLQIVLTGAHQELNQDSFAPIMVFMSISSSFTEDLLISHTSSRGSICTLGCRQTIKSTRIGGIFGYLVASGTLTEISRSSLKKVLGRFPSLVRFNISQAQCTPCLKLYICTHTFSII